MILTETIAIEQKTVALDNEGRQVDTWTTLISALPASFQPAGLNPAQATMYGITDNAANAKKVFCYRNETIIELMRINYGGRYYEIRGINHWPIHTEMIAIPVQGVLSGD